MTSNSSAQPPAPEGGKEATSSSKSLHLGDQLAKTEILETLVQQKVVSLAKPFLTTISRSVGTPVSLTYVNNVFYTVGTVGPKGTWGEEVKIVRTPSVAWSTMEGAVPNIWVDMARFSEMVVAFDPTQGKFHIDTAATESIFIGLLFHEMGHLRMTPSMPQMMLPMTYAWAYLLDEWHTFMRTQGHKFVTKLLFAIHWLRMLQTTHNPAAADASRYVGELMRPWISAMIEGVGLFPAEANDVEKANELVGRGVYLTATHMPDRVGELADFWRVFAERIEEWPQQDKVGLYDGTISASYRVAIQDWKDWEQAYQPISDTEQATWFSEMIRVDEVNWTPDQRALFASLHMTGHGWWTTTLDNNPAGLYGFLSLGRRTFPKGRGGVIQWLTWWHSFYNILEDQRLETQQANEFAGTGKYYSYLIRWIIDPHNRYFLTVGRRYLSELSRQKDLVATRAADMSEGRPQDGYYPYMEDIAVKYVGLHSTDIYARTRMAHYVQLHTILSALFNPFLPFPPKWDMEMPLIEMDIEGPSATRKTMRLPPPKPEDKKKAEERAKETAKKERQRGLATEEKRQKDPEAEARQAVAALLNAAQESLTNLWTTQKMEKHKV